MSESNGDARSTASEVTTGGLCLASLSLDHAVIGGDDNVQKRKTRRVRSLIKSSIERFKQSKPLEQQQQHRLAAHKGHSPPGSSDKRPFPFGQW